MFWKNFLFFEADGSQGGDGAGGGDHSKGGDPAKRLDYLEGELKKVIGERDTFKGELKKISDSQKTADEEKLKQQGEFEKLLGSTKTEFEDYKKSVEPRLKKADDFEKFETDKRSKIKETLGDKWVESFNSIPLSDLELVAEKLNVVPKAGDTNNGNGGNGAVLTESQKIEAKIQGLTDSQYLEVQNSRKKQ